MTDERTAIVAYLRKEARALLAPNTEGGVELLDLADAIEQGEHLKEQPQ